MDKKSARTIRYGILPKLWDLLIIDRPRILVIDDILRADMAYNSMLANPSCAKYPPYGRRERAYINSFYVEYDFGRRQNSRELRKVISDISHILPGLVDIPKQIEKGSLLSKYSLLTGLS
jgi:hypothetical protein